MLPASTRWMMRLLSSHITIDIGVLELEKAKQSPKIYRLRVSFDSHEDNGAVQHNQDNTKPEQILFIQFLRFCCFLLFVCFVVPSCFVLLPKLC